MSESCHNRIKIATILLLGVFAVTQQSGQQGEQSFAIATAPAVKQITPPARMIAPPARAVEPILKLSITVDDPTHLKVNIGQKIKVGQVISDNTIERTRLLRQRQSVQLQIQNLKSKPIPQPIPPVAPPALFPVPLHRQR